MEGIGVVEADQDRAVGGIRGIELGEVLAEGGSTVLSIDKEFEISSGKGCATDFLVKAELESFAISEELNALHARHELRACVIGRVRGCIADDLSELANAVACIVLQGPSSDGCVVGDKDGLPAAECLGVFEVDVDSTNVYTETRRSECVGGVEDSGEGVDGLSLVVVEGSEVLLVADLDDIGFGKCSCLSCVELQLELGSRCSDCVDQIRAMCVVDVELERIGVGLSRGVNPIFEVEIDAVLCELVVAGADLL